MEFDYQQLSIVGNLMAYPDFVFAGLPRQEPIDEKEYITGSTTGTSISVTGTVNQP